MLRDNVLMMVKILIFGEQFWPEVRIAVGVDSSQVDLSSLHGQIEREGKNTWVRGVLINRGLNSEFFQSAQLLRI